MPANHQRRLDVMLEPSYLAGLADLGIDEVRARHEECLAVETEVSYVRRLAQARIDIIEAELDRRARGGTLTDLVAALPQILADDSPRGDPASSRLPRHLAPAPGIQWRRGLEHLITDATLVKLPTLAEEELATTLEQLRELERQVSVTRKAMHRVIDSIEASLAERHKVGLA
jgi:peptide deformylase